MRPTAIGAPAPEPDDKPTMEELIVRTKAQMAAWRRQHDTKAQMAAWRRQHDECMARIDAYIVERNVDIVERNVDIVERNVDWAAVLDESRAARELERKRIDAWSEEFNARQAEFQESLRQLKEKYKD